MTDKKWIPVAERLPEYSDSVWAFDGTDVVLCEHWLDSGFHTLGSCRGNVIGSQFHLNVGGTWKKATPWVKVNGVWTKTTPKVRVSGAYK